LSLLKKSAFSNANLTVNVPGADILGVEASLLPWFSLSPAALNRSLITTSQNDADNEVSTLYLFVYLVFSMHSYESLHKICYFGVILSIGKDVVFSYSMLFDCQYGHNVTVILSHSQRTTNRTSQLPHLLLDSQ